MFVIHVDIGYIKYEAFMVQTSLKSREESLHRAQMVASSTKASYWEHLAGLPSWYL